MMLQRDFSTYAATTVLLRMVGKQKAYREEMERRFDRWERIMEKTMRAYFAAQQDDVLRALRSRKSVSKAMTGDELEAFRAQWDARLQEITEPVYHDIVMDSMGTALTQVGVAINFDQFDARRLDLIGDKLDKIRDVNDTTINAIREQLTEAIAAGESIPTIASRIQSVFTDADARRATVIARTEVISSSNAAAWQGYTASEVVDEKQWWASLDGRERSSHRLMHKKRVPLDKPFVVPPVGKDRAPSLMMHPGDPAGSAGNVIQCRCTTIPIVDEDAQETSDNRIDAPVEAPIPRTPLPGTETPQPASFKFSPAKTAAEAAKRLKDAGYASVHRGNVPAMSDAAFKNTANEILAQALYMQHRYPTVQLIAGRPGGLGVLVIEDLKKRRTSGFTFASLDGVSGVWVRNNVVHIDGGLGRINKFKHFDSAVERTVLEGMSTAPSTRHAAAHFAGPVYRHEFGHQIHGEYFTRPSPLPAHKGRTLDAVIQDYFNMAKKKRMTKNMHGNVSQYSKTDHKEWFAEAFTVYTSPQFKRGTLNLATGTDIEDLLAALLGG